MIAATSRGGIGILLVTLTACQGSADRVNSVQRGAWNVAISAERSERDRLQRELWRLREAVRRLSGEVDAAAVELSRVRIDEQERSAELASALALLAAEEEDLRAARARRTEITAEVARMAEEDQRLAERRQQVAAREAEAKAVEQELQAAQAALAEKRAALGPRIAAAKASLEALTAADESIRAALAAIAAEGSKEGETAEVAEPEKPADSGGK